MTDRELLELAAKAAGIDIFPHECFGSWPYRYEQSIDCNVEWNPLTDDGDALRLGVTLQLNIEHSKFHVYVGTCGKNGDDLAAESVCASISRERATRRAIVRAAAEIGKAIQ